MCTMAVHSVDDVTELSSGLLTSPPAATARRTGVPTTVIHGMPGTGKSATICSVLRAVSKRGCRVLVTALTNCAVDNILARLVVEDASIRCVRVRKPADTPAVLTMAGSSCMFVGPGASEDEPSTVDALRELLRSASVIGATTTSCVYPSTHAYVACGGPYDLCIVDEAAQLTLPGLVPALGMSKSICLVGDDEQLPPMVRSPLALSAGMGRSLFAELRHGPRFPPSPTPIESLGSLDPSIGIDAGRKSGLHGVSSSGASAVDGEAWSSGQQHSQVFGLCKQYRMCLPIQWLSNQVTYNDQLVAGSDAVASQSLLQL